MCIRDSHGDIAKSIRFGATMVMIGSLFAGHEESPGDEKIVDGKAVKEYFGSASEFQKGERKNVEGKKIFIDSKGSIFDTLVEMEQDLQSAISYAGGTTLPVSYTHLHKKRHRTLATKLMNINRLTC